jgi:hypothetical protein
MNDVDTRVERLVRECIGRIRGRFLYSEDEAKAAIRTVLKKKPARRSGYIASAETLAAPWKPGDPKPERV